VRRHDGHLEDLTPDITLNSPNDVVVNRHGVIWFTDPFWLRAANPPPAGSISGLYMISHHGDVKLIHNFGLQAQPNGVVLSEDERTLYVSLTGSNDVAEFSIGHFEFTTGSSPTKLIDSKMGTYRSANRDIFAAPDGMKIYGNFLFVAVNQAYLQAVNLGSDEDERRRSLRASQDEYMPDDFRVDLGKLGIGGIRNLAFDEKDGSIYIVCSSTLWRLTPRHFKRDEAFPFDFEPSDDS